MQPLPPDWSVFDTFKLSPGVDRRVPTWPELAAWVDLASGAVAHAEDKLRPLLHYWDHALRDFGGDPSRVNWARFRPLRLSREEDWSDWLGHLLETSTTGAFARQLFGPRLRELVTDFATPAAEREPWTDLNDRRGDLLIDWHGGAVSHVEVKIRDRNFDKTFETANGLRRARGNPRVWVDHMLISEDALLDWHECEKRRQEERRVDVLLWREVAEALRRSLFASETVMWRAWAWAFIGNIEQKLLGLGDPAEIAWLPTAARVKAVLARIDILERGTPS